MNRLTAGLFAALVVATAPVVSAAEPIAPQTAMINEQIAAKWKEADIKKPAAKATDSEFLRRVFIDLIGRIATTEEVIDFEQDKSSDKRAKLVKRLLTSKEYKPRFAGNPIKVDGKNILKYDYTDEYSEHWSNIWTVWLLSRTVDERYRAQMRIWLQSEILKETNYRDIVTQILTATGKTNENGAVTFIALQMGEMNPPEKRNELGTFDAVPITSRVTRLFLGLQTQCTQCHDHPFNKEWVQSDFWGVNAFFRQIQRTGVPTRIVAGNNRMEMALQQLELKENASVNTEGRVFYERRDGQLKSIKPTFLKDIAQADKGEPSEKHISEAGGKTRREMMAEYVVTHDNFAKAYVNRIWGHLFGRGLNKEPSIDDFGSHNEVVHPELLNKLAAEFVKYGYNSKLLLEWICNSDAYQLSHVANKEYADPKYDVYFARMPLKALTPEVLFESIMVATKSDNVKSADPKVRADSRNRWMQKLVQQFGDDEGNEMTFNGTVVQALLMMNGRELNEEVGNKGANPVLEVVKKHSKTGATNVDGVLDELFMMTLNRRPTPEEKIKLKTIQQKGAIIKQEVTKETPAPKSTTTPKQPTPKTPNPKQPNRLTPKQPAAPPGIVMPSYPNDVTFYQDVFWALLNTNEFMLNH